MSNDSKEYHRKPMSEAEVQAVVERIKRHNERRQQKAERERSDTERQLKQEGQEEKRRHIEQERRRVIMRLQQQKARRTYGEALPYAEMSGFPGWTGSLLIPDNVDNARGFDVQQLRAIIEPKRARYVAHLNRRGRIALRAEMEDLEGKKALLNERFEKNRERAEVLAQEIYPEAPEERATVVGVVSSVLGSHVEHGADRSEAEVELGRISNEQREILNSQAAMSLPLFTLRNVLYRDARGLPNDAEAWEALYEPFELSEEKLEEIEDWLGKIRERIGLPEEAQETIALPFATRSQKEHLLRAHLLLDYYGDEIGTRNDFIDKAAEMEWPQELGGASGGAIWRGVTRAGRTALDLQTHDAMPARYTRFDGFTCLVRDLRSDALSPPG